MSGGIEISIPFYRRVGNVIQKLVYVCLGPLYVCWVIYAKFIEICCCCCFGKDSYFNKMEDKADRHTLTELCGQDPTRMNPVPDLKALAEVNARLMRKNLPLTLQLSFA